MADAVLAANTLGCLFVGGLNIAYWVTWQVRARQAEMGGAVLGPLAAHDLRVRVIKSWTRLSIGVTIIIFGVIYSSTFSGHLPASAVQAILRPLLFLIIVGMAAEVIQDW